jgi:ribulose-phosphate 3-epimerase
MACLIAPSILACDFGRLAEEVTAVAQAGADWIHVDVMDGSFVPNITLGPPVVAAIHRATSLPLDVHLMIDQPERYLDSFVEAGAAVVTIHAEATTRLYYAVQRIRALGARPAVALNPGSPLELVTEVLGEVNMVLLMTVEPGFGGQSFVAPVLDKVKRLRRELTKRGLTVNIQVDGGIDERTAPGAAQAGADVLVAGTAIFGAPDYGAAISAIRLAVDGDKGA